MPRFVVSHNIPSPYRLHLFRALRRHLEKRGWDFHVHFMSAGHSERPDSWRVKGDLGFEHTFHPELGWKIVRGSSHINPGLVKAVVRTRPDLLVLGGVWDNPTNALLAALRPARTLVGWFEGNTMTPGSTNPVLRAVKRTLLARCAAWAVPGKEGRAYGEGIAGAVKRPCFTLPNIVDETSFLDVDAARRETARSWMRGLGVDPDRPVIVIPARLKVIKGLAPLLEAFARTPVSPWQVLIIGEGELEAELRARIAKPDLAGRAFLSRYVTYDQMPGIYAAASVFCLPSFVDPNPLSVVEAMHAGLPILLSNKAGNFPEALHEGVNGFGFNPDRSEELSAALQRTLGLDASARSAFGAASRRISGDFWSTERSIGAFVSQCLELHEKR